MQLWHILASGAVAFVITLTALILLQPLAIRLNYVDVPGGRKQHHGPVALTGGLAIFLGFLFAILTLDISLLDYRPLIAGMGILVFIGILDDFHELSPKHRLLAQLVVALLLVFWGGLKLTSFGDVFDFGVIQLGIWSIPISVFAIMSIINAVNMLDGLDGLAGGLAFTQLALMLWLVWQAGDQNIVILMLVIMSALLGFLVFNFPWWPKRLASVFLGDTGSMLLGLVLVWYAIRLTQGQSPIVSPVVMLWIMMIPVFEILSSVLRRLSRRRSLFTADRGHIHHIFLDAGFRPQTATYSIIALSVGFGILGLIMYYAKVAEWMIFLSYLLLFVVYHWLVAYGGRRLKLKLLMLNKRRTE